MEVVWTLMAEWGLEPHAADTVQPWTLSSQAQLPSTSGVRSGEAESRDRRSWAMFLRQRVGRTGGHVWVDSARPGEEEEVRAGVTSWIEGFAIWNFWICSDQGKQKRDNIWILSPAWSQDEVWALKTRAGSACLTAGLRVGGAVFWGRG